MKFKKLNHLLIIAGLILFIFLLRSFSSDAGKVNLVNYCSVVSACASPVYCSRCSNDYWGTYATWYDADSGCSRTTCYSAPSYSCNSGCTVGSGSYGTCDQVNCSLPWGGQIGYNSSVTAYSQSVVACGTSCASYSQTRTCGARGALSGSYVNSSCSVSSGSQCYWNGSYYNPGNQVTGYSSSTVSCGSSCSTVAGTKTCDACNGTWSNPSYSYASCSVSGCASCSSSACGTVPSGNTCTTYSSSTVSCGTSCSTVVRLSTCNNGSWDYAPYTYSSCSVSGGPQCSFNGSNYNTGQTVTGYAASAPACGTACSSAVLTCQCSGSWNPSSASYPALSCSACCNNPWGSGTTNGGNNATAYNATSATSPDTCAAHIETRSCSISTGLFSPVFDSGYTNQSCANIGATCVFPTSVAQGGVFTLTTSCGLGATAGKVDGVMDTNASATNASNSGALVIPSGVTLTIGAGNNQGLVYGKIVLRGTIVITKGVGAQLVRGPMWVKDTDADGYPDTANPSPAATRIDATYVRKDKDQANLANADCAISDNTKWQNLTGYVDADGDGYGTGTSSQVCSGVSLPSGYSANATDCNDVANRPCNVTGFTATPVSSSQINLSWTAPSTTTDPAATGYNIYYCTGASCTPSTLLVSNQSGTTYSHTSLTTGTTYGYDVYSRTSSGQGPISSIVYATTTPAPKCTISGITPTWSGSNFLFTLTTPGSYSFSCTVSENVQAEAWGAGGGGSWGQTGGGGTGGGGGAYSTSSVAITSGTGYTVVVGLGGAGGYLGSTTGVTGGQSTFKNATTVKAAGGTGGAYGGPSGQGGTTANSVGTTKYAGGKCPAYTGGPLGGGGSAGPSSNGNDSSGSYTGATAVAGGGPGGNGNYLDGPGYSPVSGPGGGGGGGDLVQNGPGNGGAGYNGQVIITSPN